MDILHTPWQPLVMYAGAGLLAGIGLYMLFDPEKWLALRYEEPLYPSPLYKKWLRVKGFLLAGVMIAFLGAALTGNGQELERTVSQTWATWSATYERMMEPPRSAVRYRYSESY